MNKAQLAEYIALETGVSQALATKVVTSATNAIKKSLSKGDVVQMVGFGTFRVSDLKARTGVNPRTGEKINIPSRKVVRFVAGKATKESVN